MTSHPVFGWVHVAFNRTGVCLEVDRDSLKRWVLIHLFGAHQGLDGSAHTYSN